MVELKVIGAILVIVSSGWLGFALRAELRQRIVFLQEFYRGLITLRQEIEYRKATMSEAARRVGQSQKEPWSSFYCMLAQRLEELPDLSFFEVWEEKRGEYLKGGSVRMEDQELISQLGRSLEQLNAGEGTRVLVVFEQNVQALAEAAKEEYRSKAQLYCRLGVMGGVFVVLLFI